MDLIVPSDRAREMAEELAERMGQSVSQVVEAALKDKLAVVPRSQVKLSPDEKRRRINELIAKLPPVPPGVTSDHSDLYDEDGLPA